MTSPYELLTAMPDVQLVWTSNQEVLRGRRARWFPGKNAIAIDSRLRRLKARCSLAHELGHVVLGHPCGGEGTLFDYRRELAADEFAARLLLHDLDELARTIVVTCSDGHAARELNVTLDLYRTRLDTLREEEFAYISEHVTTVRDGWGA